MSASRGNQIVPPLRGSTRFCPSPRPYGLGYRYAGLAARCH